MFWTVLFFALIFPTLANADGAVAVGFGKDSTLTTTTAVSRTSAANARTRALADCGALAVDCRIVHEFKDTCVATTVFNSRQLDIGTGKTAEEAGNEALRQCRAKGGPCTSEVAACDPADSATPTERVSPALQPEGDGFPWFIVFILTAVGFFAYRYKDAIKGRFVTPPAPLTFIVDPSEADTQSAQRHVTAAWDYIQKAILATKPLNVTTEGIEEITGTLNLAAEHLVKARTFDPNVETETEYDDRPKISQASLTGMLLYIESGCEVMLANKSPFAFFGRRHLKRAIAALQQAIGYESQPTYYSKLAEAYALLGDQDNAKLYVRKALDLDPNHIESVQLETALPKIAELHPRPPFFELKVGIFAIAAFLLALAFFALTTGTFSESTRYSIYVLAFSPIVILFVYYAARNQLRHKLGSMWWTYTHFKEKKKEHKRKEFINELHAKRWRSTGGSVWRDI